ncbi:unnamed protein product [Cylicocyclus nassatus]|uniref:Peptidase S1 domain-containing protein n=1 Tax=Cylicocyclus nassatus TaxID=53992 RepID=A0AA36HFG8_CYLNA|nr:unnamed protein product [Cylicocyclus nassatus]
MMVTPFFLLLLVGAQIQSQKLTTRENELNRKNCGVHFLGQPIQKNRLVKKSYGGREFEENEYPWSVVIFIGKTVCSGVQISPRHILTATHCVLDFDEEERIELCARDQPHSIVPMLTKPEEITIFIGGGRDHCNSLICHNKNLYRARKITTKELNM